MISNHMLRTSLLIGSAAALTCGIFANDPLPEIAAWEETPEWCPAYAIIFPLDYLAGNYTICENLPAMLMLHTNAGAEDKERLKMTNAPSCLLLELPDFLKLEGVCVYETRGGKSGADRWFPCPGTQTQGFDGGAA